MTDSEKIAIAKQFELRLKEEYRFTNTMQGSAENERHLRFFNAGIGHVKRINRYILNREDNMLIFEINRGIRKINAMGGIDIAPEKTGFQKNTDKLQKDLEMDSQKDRETEKEIQEKTDQKKTEEAAQDEHVIIDDGFAEKVRMKLVIEEEDDDLTKGADSFFDKVNAGTLGQPVVKEQAVTPKYEQEDALTM